MGNLTKTYSKFNHKKSWKIVLTNPVYDKINQNLDKIPDGIKAESVFYLASKMEYKIAMKNKEINDFGFVPFPSRELKRYNLKYAIIINFLINIGILSKRNYSTAKKRCNQYKINYNKLFKDGEKTTSIIEIELTKKNNNDFREDINSREVHHLTRWLRKGFEFDYYTFLGSDLAVAKYNSYFKGSESKPLSKLICIYQAINNIKEDYYRASRNIDSDNRLHSLLTNLPSSLRPFVKFKGQTLFSLDIKNSQPFFLLILLEGYRKDNNRINKILNRIFNYKSIVSQELIKTISSKGFPAELERYKKLVIGGEFYEGLADICDVKPNENGEFQLIVYNKSTKKNKRINFNNSRDCAKSLALKIIFGNNEKLSKEYKLFKNAFPLISEFMEKLKSITDYKRFALLLQHIEADCVLDYITFIIAKKYPEMPIFTIHDSIITTEEHIDKLELLINPLLDEYCFNLRPVLKRECWCLEDDYLKAA